MESLEHISEKPHMHHGGSERIASAEAKGQRIVGEEMARRGWSEAELEQRRQADAEKIRITRRLRAETTMTWGWTAERLAMGTSGYTQTVCGLSAQDRACCQDMRICRTDPFPGLTRFRFRICGTDPFPIPYQLF